MACTDMVPIGIEILDLGRKLYICTLVVIYSSHLNVNFQCPIPVHIQFAHSNQYGVCTAMAKTVLDGGMVPRHAFNTATSTPSTRHMYHIKRLLRQANVRS